MDLLHFTDAFCNRTRQPQILPAQKRATIFSMNRPVGFLLGLGVCLRAFFAQVPASGPEDTEPYEIYSTVLQVMHPNVTEWMILNKTRGFAFCSTPARDQDALYRPMLDDYTRRNKTTVPLERKFNLANYLLVGDQQGAGKTKQDTATVFSAVGFNQERTRAAVCSWINSNGGCSVLVKSDGTWKFDKGWRGNGCG
jgi:hypothetical protein